ncbi:hypothetical protein LA76x_3620 [Lysobacter antibioticus]|uniref:Uncharacterized protein n=1 Tax=Lysobacter antibioticus TaxID=84531 RepID=A0A0S2FDX1_LYSAN|nr:hypothetical protein LA76x_3620 [Lysobacter antibioticus]
MIWIQILILLVSDAPQDRNGAVAARAAPTLRKHAASMSDIGVVVSTHSLVATHVALT